MTDVEEGVLDRVRKILDRANHPNTPDGERETALRMADRLITKHAIDEALLDAAGRDDRRTPITKRIRAWEGFDWQAKFRTMVAEIAKTVRCKVALHPGGDITVVGMREDVEYLEMMWTVVYLNFVSKMNPRWDNTLSFEHNVYNFKKAGYKWPSIRDKARANNCWVDWPDGGRLIRAYKKHARMVGDESLVSTQRHSAYRESFSEGFTNTICAMLEEMRSQQREDSKDSVPGAALALRSIDEQVQESFYEAFPNFRPLSDEEFQERLEERRRIQEQEAREEQERLDAMTPAERRKHDEQVEAKRRKEAKESDRFWRDLMRQRDAKYDPSGIAAGTKAGRETDLTGGRRGMGGTKVRGEIS
jgi:hypothetical protein